MEFGSSAYVRSEQVPLILSELQAERANLESAQVSVVAADENTKLRNNWKPETRITTHFSPN